MLLFVEPARQDAVKAELAEYLHIPFSFDFDGSKINEAKGLLCIDLHDDHSIRADPWRHSQNQSDIFKFDVVDLAGLVDG